MPHRNPARAMQVLDMMLEFFDGGRKWLCEEMIGPDGQSRCLIGALRHVRKEHDIRRDGTVHYLREAAWPTPPFSNPHELYIFKRGDRDLMSFNDGSTYDEVRQLIVEARAIAQTELDAKRQPQRRTTKLVQPEQNIVARSDRPEAGDRLDPKKPPRLEQIEKKLDLTHA